MASGKGCEVTLFGGVAVALDGVPVPLDGPLSAHVLALLVMSGKPVGRGDLVNEVWPLGHTPAAFNSRLSRLKAALRPIDGLELGKERGRPVRYRLDVDDACVDVHRFTAAARHALDAAEDGAADAEELLEGCLARWAGTPFEGLDGVKINTWRRQLEDQRTAVRVALLRLGAVHGRAHDLVDEAVELSTAHPRHRAARDLAAHLLELVGRAEEIALLPGTDRQVGRGSSPPVNADELLLYLRSLRAGLTRTLRWHPGEDISTTFSERSVRVIGDPSRDQLLEGGHAPQRRDLVRGDQSWTEAVALARLIVVLGDAGYGKTWQLRAHGVALCDRGIQALRAGDDPATVDIPLWTHSSGLAAASLLGRGKPQHVVDAAAAVLSDPEAELGKSLRAAMVHGLASGDGRLHVLVDALDEVFDSNSRDRVAGTLSWLAERVRAGAGTRAVVTSRPVGYTDPFGAGRSAAGRRPVPVHHLALAAFGTEQVSAFWRTWFDQRGLAFPDERLSPLLDADSPLADHVRVPLIAAFCAWIAEEEPADRTRAGLYEQVVRRFIGLSWKQGDRTAVDHRTRSDPLRQKQIRHALEQLAWHMSTAHAEWRDAVDDEECEEQLAGTGLRALPGWTRTNELVTLHGLLLRLGVSARELWDTPVTWVHPTLHEYLTAHRLIDAEQSEIDRWLDHGLHRPEWESTFRFAVELER